MGDVARRALPLLRGHWRVLALVRDAAAAARAREGGAVPLLADLDDAASLRRCAGLADVVWITAPPPASGTVDSRMRNLLAALARGGRPPRRLCYIGTTGVYGDCNGAWLDETRAPAPQSARAWRRLDAERRLRAFAMAHGCALSILRAGGIYARERLPLKRLLQDIPLIAHAQDSLVNHIHADDLARACVAALQARVGGIRVYNACDDLPCGISAWYGLLAAALQLPLPPLLGREQVRQRVRPELWSFMAESRRIRNRRLRQELGVDLRYADVGQFAAELAASADPHAGFSS
jgi:nucleoside-diphosphate-sugar epimerase